MVSHHRHQFLQQLISFTCNVRQGYGIHVMLLMIVLQQLQMKNQQLKEIIDQLRTIIWEINTMMTMRRTVSR